MWPEQTTSCNRISARLWGRGVVGAFVPLHYRLLALLFISALAFGIGSAIFFTHSGGEGDYYWIAIALFPMGFGFGGSYNELLMLSVGWLFYGACLLVAMLCGRLKLFLAAICLLGLGLSVNLAGCDRILKEGGATHSPNEDMFYGEP